MKGARVGTFGERVLGAVRERGPLCVGVDPHAALLARWGLPDTVDGLRRFAETVVAALAPRVAAVKPQSAFFERFGSAGVAVLESTIRQSREAGAVVIVDAKRGDIGSTVEAYADAYLDPASALCGDAVTANPYLGFGALAPMLERVTAYGTGLLVLALTSNPDGWGIQRAKVEDGRTVAQTVIDAVASRNQGVQPLGSVGLVVGATSAAGDHDLSELNGPVLVPGLGAQGAAPEDLRVFTGLRGLVLPAYSREVLAAGPGIDDLRAAAERCVAACRKALECPTA